MLSLHTNVAALSAQNSLSNTQNSLSTSMTRLSTGYRINSAMDDAAGLQIATRLNAQASGMTVAMQNTQNSISMMQTADGAFNEVTNILSRMKDLATQAADASSSAQDQTAMQSEYDALGGELANIMNNTSYGGTTLLKAGTGNSTLGGGTVTFQIGAGQTETMTVNTSAQISTLDTALQGISAAYKTAGSAGTEIGGGASAAANQTSANAQIAALTTAINDVGAVRSTLGATGNTLNHVYNNLQSMDTNTKAASGRIMDVDYASESSNMTSAQMQMQAGTAMLKQTNSMSSMVMSLLQ